MGYPIAPTLTRERADAADPAPGEAGGRAAEIMARLLWLGDEGAGRSRADAGAAAPVAARSGRAAPLAFLSRCVVLQAIGAAGLVGLWVAGIASRPFEGDNGFLCWLIVAIAALGVLCVFLQRWSDVEWLATHVVRIGLLGTVIGLIIAFSAAKAGGSADPSAIKPMIAAVVDGMYVSLYATLLGPAPGNVIIEAQWPDKLDADLDLWVQAPGDVPVGYSNKSGRIFNLLRDDLGRAHDITDYNYEVAYTRGTPGGEYVVNLHLYRGRGVAFPVAAKIVASVKQDPTGAARQLVATTVQLRKEGQELTALRFRLDADGKLVAGSVNSLYKPLRAAAR